jgi:hypothetical protein
MKVQFKELFNKFRRRTFPPSVADTMWRHDALMARFDEIERRLAMLPEVERALALLERNLAVSEEFAPMTQFHPDDVFIVAYPKSGVTWFQNLVAGAVYGVNPRFGPRILAHDLVPDIGYVKFYRRYATPMYFKSHGLPCPEYRRVVYLLRDGRDVMVSYRHYLGALYGMASDFLNFVSPETEVYPCHWAKHVDAWLRNPYQARMLIIRYEDLLREPVTELQRFCTFAGLSREAEHLATIAEAAAFQNLRSREERIGFDRPDVSFPPGMFFFRRGEAGSHKDEMSAEVLERFLEHSAETLRRCGYAICEDKVRGNDPGVGSGDKTGAEL